VTKDCGEGDNFLRFAVFPIRDADFVEIKHQFGYTVLLALVQILNCSLEQRSRYLRGFGKLNDPSQTRLSFFVVIQSHLTKLYPRQLLHLSAHVNLAESACNAGHLLSLQNCFLLQ
jgi:hypothetical protein